MVDEGTDADFRIANCACAGQIPMQLAQLTGMRALLLDHNKLAGRVLVARCKVNGGTDPILIFEFAMPRSDSHGARTTDGNEGTEPPRSTPIDRFDFGWPLYLSR